MTCRFATCASGSPTNLNKMFPHFRLRWWTRCGGPSPALSKVWWTRRACSTLPFWLKRQRKTRAISGNTTRACRAKSGRSCGFTTASTVTSACRCAPTLPISCTRPRRWIMTTPTLDSRRMNHRRRCRGRFQGGEIASTGQLRRRLQRLRKLRRLLPRGRRPVHREAPFFRQPRNLQEICGPKWFLHRI